MNAPASARTSAGMTRWLIILLMLGWLAFVFVPWPTKRKKMVNRIPLEHFLVSKLNAVGLPDNPDYDGLPEIFEIWSAKAEWKDGRTRFAYWHPVMKTYSYYFEAVRVEGKFYFTEIAEPKEANFYWDESLGEECPIRFYVAVPVARRDPVGSKFEGEPASSSELKSDVPLRKEQPMN